MQNPRNMLAQLIDVGDMETLSPDELRSMLADLDDQVIYGGDDVEITLPGH